MNAQQREAIVRSKIGDARSFEELRIQRLEARLAQVEAARQALPMLVTLEVIRQETGESVSREWIRVFLDEAGVEPYRGGRGSAYVYRREDVAKAFAKADIEFVSAKREPRKTRN